MENDAKDKQRGIVEDIEHLVEDVNRAVRKAVSHGSDAAESVGETLKDTLKVTIMGARSARDSVVMIRVDKESLSRVDELVDAGLANSRSEAAAFLIGEGIKSRQPLFDKIAESVEQIRATKDELRSLLMDEEQPEASQPPT